VGRFRFWLGLIVGLGLAVIVHEVPYINWKPLVPPIETRPLVVRQDAKGDGRFKAPRSGGRRHRGIDLVAPLGSPVKAFRSGTVVQVGTHRGLGRFVVIEHRHQLTSLYAHLATTGVAVGERVKQGAVIGTVGKTGNAHHPWITPHVHFEIVRGGQPVDPATLGVQAMVFSSEGPKTAGGQLVQSTVAYLQGSQTDDRGGE